MKHSSVMVEFNSTAASAKSFKPLSRYTILRECDENTTIQNDRYSKENISKFLMAVGLTDLSPYLLSCLAELVKLSSNQVKYRLYDKLQELSKGYMTAAALSLQLSYHINYDFDRVRATLLQIAGPYFDIGAKFDGNKNFINKISLIYNLFGDVIYINIHSV